MTTNANQLPASGYIQDPITDILNGAKTAYETGKDVLTGKKTNPDGSITNADGTVTPAPAPVAATAAKPFYENPIVLVGAAVAAYFLFFRK